MDSQNYDLIILAIILLAKLHKYVILSKLPAVLTNQRPEAAMGVV